MVGRGTILGLVLAGGGYVSSADGRTLSFISYCCRAVAVSKSCGRADLRRIKRDALGLDLPCCVCEREREGGQADGQEGRGREGEGKGKREGKEGELHVP